MKIQCPKCKTEYQLDEEKIPSKGAYTRCKTCGTRFLAQKETGSKEAETDQMAAHDTSVEEQIVDQYVEQDNQEAAAKLLYNLIKRHAKEKNFKKADALRDKLYQDVPMALDTIVKSNEFIEENKRKSIDQKHLEAWRNLYESLTPDETIEFYFSMTELILKPDDLVFEQGERNSNLYFVQSGLLKLFYIDHTSKKEIVLKELAIGDVANVDSFFSAALCTQTLVALAETKLTYLEKDVLIKWREKFPGIKTKLNHFCQDRGNIRALIQKEKLERRAHERLKIPLKANVQLLDVSGQAKKKPFKVTLYDISAGGVSYTYRLSNEEEVNKLLEHNLALQIDYSTSAGEQKVVKRGKIVAAHLLPFGESAIHVQFQTLLENQIIDAIKSFKQGN